MAKKEGAEIVEPKPVKKLIAKRDFVISHNEHHIEIKEGDDLSHVPELFIQNLITEKVL